MVINPMTDAEDPSKQPLVDLAAQMTAYFRSGEYTVSLSGPESLTVWKVGKGFSKAPMIGGEEFRPTEAYVGKKGAILVKFSPQETSGFAHAEMPADDAIRRMTGFSDLAIASGYSSIIADIKKAERAERDAELAKVKMNDYANFGSW